MKRFVDLHLCPTLQDHAQTEALVSKSSELDYDAVGISVPVDTHGDAFSRLRKICNDAKVDLITRTDLAPKTPNELLNCLRRYRQRFELISVTCLSKPVARQAAKDRRVDILSFPIFDRKRLFFDHAEAELASKSCASVEISMSSLLRSKDFQRIHLLASLRKIVITARKFHVPIVISSGATCQYEMRGPREFASLAFLFSINSSDALHSLSECPLNIVNRNREKLSPNYVIDGVRIVKRGNDRLDQKEEDI